MANENRLSEGARLYALALAKQSYTFSNLHELLASVWQEGYDTGKEATRELFNRKELPPEPNRCGHSGDDLR